MSRALAFVTGAAVIIAVLLFLFTPDTDSGTDPAPDTETGSPETGSNQSALPGDDSSGDGPAPRVRGGNLIEDVSRWPDPDATGALPARPSNPARNARPVVSLWKTGDTPGKTQVDGFPATRLKADPDTLNSLHVGQQVVLQVPELNRTVTAHLNSTHNQLNDIRVFRGSVSSGHEDDSVVVTRGRRSTYVVLSTREGTYSAVIDNHSGDAALTSETDIQDNLAGHDDAIPVPGIDQEPPGDPSG